MATIKKFWINTIAIETTFIEMNDGRTIERQRKIDRDAGDKILEETYDGHMDIEELSEEDQDEIAELEENH